MIGAELFSMDIVVFTILALLAWFVLPVLYKLWRWILKVRRSGQALDKFPGPPTHWLMGNLDVFPGYNHAGMHYLLDMTKKYGPRAYRLWFGRVQVMLEIIHPETMKQVMMQTEAKPLSWGGNYTTLVPWLGDGLLTSKGQKWFRNRKLLTPAFHFGVLRPYIKIYNEAVDTLMSKLEVEGEGGKKSIDVFKPVSLCTLNIILRCAFSYEEDVQTIGEKSQYVNGLSAMASLNVKRLTNVLYYWKRVYYCTSQGKEYCRIVKLLRDISSEVIQSRKRGLAMNAEPKKKYPDFLDILLLARDENGEGLTEQEIRNEVDTFLFEGHDTTASGISFILYALANNPEHQQKCQEEVDALFADRDDHDIVWEDLTRIPYLTLCIKEAMRIYPPVPFVSREATEEFELDGVQIPVGTYLDLFVYLLHHNEEVWGPNHWDFVPERFLQKNIEKMDPFAYVPFSSGSRNCIGQNFAMNEMKVTVCKILHRFSLSVDHTRPLKIVPEIVLRGEDGIRIHLHPRKM